MREQEHPSSFALEEAFPERRELAGYTGCGVLEAERDGRYYVIFDERPHAARLDPTDPADRAVLARVVRIFEFDSEEERRAWLRGQLGPQLG